MIHIENIHLYRNDKVILNELSWHVEKGQHWAIFVGGIDGHVENSLSANGVADIDIVSGDGEQSFSDEDGILQASGGFDEVLRACGIELELLDECGKFDFELFF